MGISYLSSVRWVTEHSPTFSSPNLSWHDNQSGLCCLNYLSILSAFLFILYLALGIWRVLHLRGLVCGPLDPTGYAISKGLWGYYYVWFIALLVSGCLGT